jgi:hypothetical protein
MLAFSDTDSGAVAREEDGTSCPSRQVTIQVIQGTGWQEPR